VRESSSVKINDRLSIPDDELEFTASRSGGPGGQHVNKVSSRMTLRFDVVGSPSLTADQKRRVRRRLATRISREGVLRVVCQAHRSQAANRREAGGRFAELLRGALERRKPRRKTVVPLGVRRRRLENKRRRGRLKRDRTEDDD
jgi:ribosome-associated protein